MPREPEREEVELDFSVFETALDRLKTGNSSSPAVGQASSTRIGGQPATLLRWCRSTEQILLRRDLRDARVFVGFECFSRAAFVAKRYARIGSVCRALHVFGKADQPLAFEATTRTEITTGPLLREWFLVVESDSYCGLLSARDLDGLEGTTSPRHRRFEGVITHHVATIRALADALEEQIEAHSSR